MNSVRYFLFKRKVIVLRIQMKNLTSAIQLGLPFSHTLFKATIVQGIKIGLGVVNFFIKG